MLDLGVREGAVERGEVVLVADVVNTADVDGTLSRVVVRFHRGDMFDIPACDRGVAVTSKLFVRTPRLENWHG